MGGAQFVAQSHGYMYMYMYLILKLNLPTPKKLDRLTDKSRR